MKKDIDIDIILSIGIGHVHYYYNCINYITYITRYKSIKLYEFWSNFNKF